HRQRAGLLLVALARPAVAQGRDLGPGPAPGRAAARLRRRRAAAPRRPAGRRLPHRPPLLLLPRRPQRRLADDRRAAGRPEAALSRLSSKRQRPSRLAWQPTAACGKSRADPLCGYALGSSGRPAGDTIAATALGGNDETE